MPRLVWDDRALDDLDALAAHIAADNAAARVVEYIRARARLLETLPGLGFASPEPGLRELILTRYPYILVYEPRDEEVRVLAVFHHAQQRR